jgi:hypothetical protein
MGGVPQRLGAHGGRRGRGDVGHRFGVADAETRLPPLDQLRPGRPRGPHGDGARRGPTPRRPRAAGTPGRRGRPQRPGTRALPPHGESRAPAYRPGVEDRFLHAGRRAVPAHPGARARPARESGAPLPAAWTGPPGSQPLAGRRRPPPRGPHGSAPVPGGRPGSSRRRLHRGDRLRRPGGEAGGEGTPSRRTPARARRHGREGLRRRLGRLTTCITIETGGPLWRVVRHISSPRNRAAARRRPRRIRAGRWTSSRAWS